MGFNEEHAIETFKSLISISTEAFKALQWLNGGAIVALLAYLGQVAASPSIVARATFPMTLFVAGLVSSTAAFVTAYLTQLALHNENISSPTFRGPKHKFWLWVTFIICIVSIVFFAWGAFACLNVFSSPAVP
ncbi:MAG: hypothetical protein AB1899_03030 [Pseudomonadota bacterium]